MNRRKFLGAAAAPVSLWPFCTRAQAPLGHPVIALLSGQSRASLESRRNAFLQAMREFGYIEGRDFTLEERYADGDQAVVPGLAADLVRLRPSVIVASPVSAAAAVQRVTSSIPIVGSGLANPVEAGLIVSEARPGKNVTGIQIRIDGLPAKQVEIAHDLVPAATKIGILAATPPTNRQNLEVEAAAATMMLRSQQIEARTVSEVTVAFQRFAQERADIIVVLQNATLLNMRRQIAAHALVARLPTVFSAREHVEHGGLISYGVSQRELYRRTAYFVNRILKGEKPADLPVEFPTKLEMVVNNATAKALGITIPPSIFIRADEVIE